MKLFPVLNKSLILALRLPIILCWPILSESIIYRPLQPLNSTTPSAGTGLRLNTTTNSYPIEWPIHRTSIILYIQHESRSSLKLSETMLLLDQATSVADDKDKTESLRDTFESRLDSDKGPLFAIGPSLPLRALKWEDVSNIVGGLIQYYIDKCGSTKKCSEISFAIEDSGRGELGSGVVMKARKRIMAMEGENTDISSTS